MAPGVRTCPGTRPPKWALGQLIQPGSGCATLSSPTWIHSGRAGSVSEPGQRPSSPSGPRPRLLSQAAGHFCKGHRQTCEDAATCGHAQSAHCMVSQCAAFDTDTQGCCPRLCARVEGPRDAMKPTTQAPTPALQHCPRGPSALSEGWRSPGWQVRSLSMYTHVCTYVHVGRHLCVSMCMCGSVLRVYWTHTCGSMSVCMCSFERRCVRVSVPHIWMCEHVNTSSLCSFCPSGPRVAVWQGEETPGRKAFGAAEGFQQLCAAREDCGPASSGAL